MGKDFKAPKIGYEAPEASFMQETAEKTKQPTAKPTAPEGMKIDYRYVEKRTRRVQLVLQPSLYTKIKDKAALMGMSFNDYCHRALEESIEKY
jgi:predicted DNA binding CopG/RHH family protein